MNRKFQYQEVSPGLFKVWKALNVCFLMCGCCQRSRRELPGPTRVWGVGQWWLLLLLLLRVPQLRGRDPHCSHHTQTGLSLKPPGFSRILQDPPGPRILNLNSILFYACFTLWVIKEWEGHRAVMWTMTAAFPEHSTTSHSPPQIMDLDQFLENLVRGSWFCL